MKPIVISILLLTCSSFYSQYKYLNDYIPCDSCSYITHPLIEIKTWIHIMQKSEEDPQNITIDSMHYIHKQFQWINQMYSQLKPPTRPSTNGGKPYVKDSRIRFTIDTITFHIDSNDWDRMKSSPMIEERKWLPILKIDPDSNTILIKGIRDRFRPILDSLIVYKSCCNNGIHHTLKTKRKGDNTLIYIKENINVEELNFGFVSYFQTINKNCHKDIWEKYTNEDKTHLHVFYTGASMDVPAFGCGPSPYFLNVSKIIKNGGYATAQLTAHELGHCIGLSHTNTPQFNDLPRSDKFGWINCNQTNTSNNIMGYNTCRNYLSPLQIAHIHYRYSNVDQLINTVKIHSNNQDHIYINNDTSWHKSIIIDRNIVIKKKQTLTIKKKICMAPNTMIILEKKSKLIIDDGIIKCCNGSWEGVRKCKSQFNLYKIPKKEKNIAIIELINNGKLVID